MKSQNRRRRKFVESCSTFQHGARLDKRSEDFLFIFYLFLSLPGAPSFRPATSPSFSCASGHQQVPNTMFFLAASCEPQGVCIFSRFILETNQVFLQPFSVLLCLSKSIVQSWMWQNKDLGKAFIVNHQIDAEIWAKSPAHTLSVATHSFKAYSFRANLKRRVCCCVLILVIPCHQSLFSICC